MSDRFRGKVALVTGAASGIGRGLALRLAGEGAAVVLGDLDDSGLARLAEELSERLYRVTWLEADVTRAKDCDALVQSAQNHWGGLDLVFNCAGVGGGDRVEKTSEAEWDHVVQTNLKGTFLMCRSALPALRKRGGGCIITLSSLAGIRSPAAFSAYAASKAGVIQFSRVLALEAARDRIRVNALCPVWINTPMLESYLAATGRPAQARRSLEAGIPLGRTGTVEDVVAAALFLASDEASFITGVALPIDGGSLCQ